MRGRMPWAAVVVFWVFVAVLYDGQILWLSRMPGEKIDLRAAFAWQTAYYLLWIPLTLVVWRATAGWIPESSRDWVRTSARHLPLFLGTAMAHFVAVAMLSRVLGVWQPQPEPFWSSVLMQMRGRLHLELLIYTAAAGTGAALVLHQRYRDRELAAVRLQAELSAARLDALRGQLQPHFLFNSLHSIASLARAGDTAGVVRLIAGFSDILRHLLSAGDRHLPLKAELELVERYLEIQRVRFADRLHVSIDLDPAAAEARVPLLIVQPLVENALRHGLAARVEPGAVHVHAWRDNGATRIDVDDTGVGLPAGWSLATTGGTGLRNLASRLGGGFGGSASLHVIRRPDGGVRATVRVPFSLS